MSIERVREYFKTLGIADRIKEIDESSATVALAAKALGCVEGRIAKTISFSLDGAPILIVAAGDMKIDNANTRPASAKRRRCSRTKKRQSSSVTQSAEYARSR